MACKGEEMRSEQINELAQALSKAQGEMKPASKSGKNPHFKSNYSTMQDLINASKSPLSTNGLSVTQITSEVDAGVLLETYLMHTSGQWLQSEMLLKPMKDGPQALGSALTYARRYCYESILGMSGIPDDDAEQAEQKQKPQQQTNGNGQKKKHTANDFKIWVNDQLPESERYSHIAHLRNSIRKESGIDNFDWPDPFDTDSWKQIVEWGKAIVERKAELATQETLPE